MRPLVVIDDDEAQVLTKYFLHCGSVQPGDEWDTDVAWVDPDIRQLARRLLVRYRKTGELPTDDERRLLATCCGG